MLLSRAPRLVSPSSRRCRSEVVARRCAPVQLRTSETPPKPVDYTARARCVKPHSAACCDSAPAMRHAALLDDDDELTARRNGGAAAGPSSAARAVAAVDDDAAGFEAAVDEEEYVPVKQRRLNEMQGRYRRLGLSSAALGAPSARDIPEAREAPPVRELRPSAAYAQRLTHALFSGCQGEPVGARSGAETRETRGGRERETSTRRAGDPDQHHGAFRARAPPPL